MTATASSKSIAVFLSAGLFLLLAFGARVANSAQQSLEEVREKWIGQKVETLMDKHGYPDDTITAPNGNRVLVFSKNVLSIYTVPVYTPPQSRDIELYNTRTGQYSYGQTRSNGGVSFEHQTEKSVCTGYFEVDKDGKIIAVRFKGEACPQ